MVNNKTLFDLHPLAEQQGLCSSVKTKIVYLSNLTPIKANIQKKLKVQYVHQAYFLTLV